MRKAATLAANTLQPIVSLFSRLLHDHPSSVDETSGEEDDSEQKVPFPRPEMRLTADQLEDVTEKVMLIQTYFEDGKKAEKAKGGKATAPTPGATTSIGPAPTTPAKAGEPNEVAGLKARMAQMEAEHKVNLKHYEGKITKLEAKLTKASGEKDAEKANLKKSRRKARS